MDGNEGLSKLWFEKHLDQITHTSGQVNYQIAKTKLTDKQLKQAHKIHKTDKINLEEIIHAAWGLLLNYFSSTDHILYGVAQAQILKKNVIKVNTPFQIVSSNIDATITLKSFIKKTQPQKKLNVNEVIPDEIRYLFLTKSDSKKTTKKSSSKTLTLDPKRYPLILAVDKKNPRVVLLYYHPNIYNEHNITNFLEHFNILIENICENIHQKVMQINLLTEKEKKLILTKWNKPTYPFKIGKINTCVHDLLEKQAKKFPDLLAVSHNQTKVTYKELNDAATYLAEYLIANGIEPGDNVAVLMERTPTLLIAMFAIFKCGAVYVPINLKYPDERIEFVLTDSEARFVILNNIERLPAKYKSNSLVIHQSWKDINLKPIKDKPILPKVDPEQLAYIIYTSGTTGKPKGVMIRHKSLSNFVAWYRANFHITEKDRSSQFASPSFDSFFCETIPFLATGGSVHIVDDIIKLSPTLFFEWLQKQQITICDIPTAYAKILFTMPWPNDLALKTLKIGGENLSAYPTQKFSFDIWNIYGPTETTIETTFAKIYSANSSPRKTKRHAPPIGKPLAGSEVYVVNSHMQPVPKGIAGELLIGGDIVSTGYLNRTELTGEKFIHLPISQSKEKFYRTGDLVRWLEDGNLEFIGRIDHQVKIRGYRIELGDVETAISQHPDVNEVAVIAKENISGEKSLIAYVVPNLDKERYLYQERCLVSLNTYHYIEAVTEDISKEGIAISGITEKLTPGQIIKLHLKLPGFTEGRLFTGHVIWQQETRSGIGFELSEEEKNIINKSIDYYLSTHNVMELVLSASAKRSLRKALRRKLPDYMVPSTFVTLLQFPLTFSGKIDLKALPPPQEFEQILRKEQIPAKTDTEKKLEKIWKDILHKDIISMSDSFFDVGGSSLTVAELSVRILNKFKISIPTKILFDLPYIPILAEYIDTNGAKYATQSVIQEEILHDSALPENIIPTKKLSPSPKHPKNILLTGAGGFLGIYLLRELLAKTKAKIYCLIRKGDFETAAKRLIATINKFNLNKDISLADRRIIAIASDISFDHFGLPPEQYNNLLDKIDLIFHCGAQVNIMAAYNKLRGSNVQGTLEVIKFASTKVIKPIHYISTLSAACDYDSAGTLAEVFPSENYDELFGGYAISKWVSERLLTQLKNHGVPATIYRSGYISGQSDNGMTSLNDALFMLIKGCIQLGFAPEMDERVTILPVDFVSKAIVAISLKKPHKSQVYHLDHPTGIMWTDLISWLNDYGYRIKLIPIKKWQNLLLTITPENALYPFLPYYLALKENYKSPDVNSSLTIHELKKLHIDYPEINERLLTTYFDFLCEINYIPMPNQVEATD